MSDPPLTEQMAEALRGKEFITNRGDRIRAYSDAKITLANVSDREWRDADELALSTELARRLAS